MVLSHRHDPSNSASHTYISSPIHLILLPPLRNSRNARSQRTVNSMQFDRLKRREFISLIGSAVAAPALLLPRAAHARQQGLLRRIGVLMHLAADDHEGQARLAAFMQGLEQSGWTAGRNVQIDFRWGVNDA